MKRKSNTHREFEKAFAKNHAGYVLITCENPTSDGNMSVEMTYGGSVTLANILVDGAHLFLDEDLSLDEMEVGKDQGPQIQLIKS